MDLTGSRGTVYGGDRIPGIPGSGSNSPATEAIVPAFQWAPAGQSMPWRQVGFRGVVAWVVQWGSPLLECWPQMPNRPQRSNTRPSVERRFPGLHIQVHIASPIAMFAFGAAAWSATYDLEVAEGDPDQITSALWMGPQDCKSKLVETNGHLRWTINPAPRFVRFKLWIVNMNAVAPDFDPLVISGSCLPLSVRT